MIITCPNCQTRYQVADTAIGSAGRKVQCANCRQSWRATPDPVRPRPKPARASAAAQQMAADPDRLFSEADEAALDAEFEQAEGRAAFKEAETPPPAPEPPAPPAGNAAAETLPEQKPVREALADGLAGVRQRTAVKRRLAFARRLPLGRIRTNLRVFGLVALAVLIGGGLSFRTEVVRWFPDLAGVYSAIGLPVNVLGLEFRDVETLRTIQNGKDVMIISGRIQNVTPRQVKVPPIVVSIHDSSGTSLYSWSVAPTFSLIGSGEILDFETQLNTSPDGAETVRLEFANGRAN